MKPINHRIPRPVRRAPHPRTMERGAPYGLLVGGMITARSASQAPKMAKTRGKAAPREKPVMNEVRSNPPRIMRKAPRLRGAQGSRIDYYR